MQRRRRTSEYHHGKEIKKAREELGMSQAQLAEVWPRSDEGIGVSVTYVHEVETGKKHITDQYTLRGLCEILHIPHWRFGLSEYDPFHPEILPGHGRSLYDETLDTAEQLIQQTWSLRHAARITEAEKGVKRLNELFVYLRENLSPPARLELRYQLLHAQVRRLNAVTALERKQYKETLDTYTEMYEAVKNLGNASSVAIALMSMGTELERVDKKDEAVSRLEEARDASLSASKQVIAFVHSYLARVYAGVGDAVRFQRAIHTAKTFADALKENYSDGSDFVYAWTPLSAIAAEESYGYLELGEPRKTLEMQQEITRQIALDGDARLNAWIPLDWARAYYMLGEIEKCMDVGREFLRRALAMQSPHAVGRAYQLLASLEKDGYGDVQAVKDFREELHEEKAQGKKQDTA